MSKTIKVQAFQNLAGDKVKVTLQTENGENIRHVERELVRVNDQIFNGLDLAGREATYLFSPNNDACRIIKPL